MATTDLFLQEFFPPDRVFTAQHLTLICISELTLHEAEGTKTTRKYPRFSHATSTTRTQPDCQFAFRGESDGVALCTVRASDRQQVPRWPLLPLRRLPHAACREVRERTNASQTYRHTSDIDQILSGFGGRGTRIFPLLQTRCHGRTRRLAARGPRVSPVSGLR